MYETQKLRAYMHLASLKDFTGQLWIEDNLAIDPFIRPGGTHVLYDKTRDAELEPMFVPIICDANEVSSQASSKSSRGSYGQARTTHRPSCGRSPFKISIHCQIRLACKLEYLRET